MSFVVIVRGTTSDQYRHQETAQQETTQQEAQQEEAQTTQQEEAQQETAHKREEIGLLFSPIDRSSSTMFEAFITLCVAIARLTAVQRKEADTAAHSEEANYYTDWPEGTGDGESRSQTQYR